MTGSSDGNNATIGWNDSDPSGDPLEEYFINCVLDGETCDEVGITAGPFNATGTAGALNSGDITGLADATTYNCYVIASNDAGDVCSTSFANITIPPASPP